MSEISEIKEVIAREILDSRGYPTVEAEVHLFSGETACASVPSGASTGLREAVELRDGGARYQGKGVLKAIRSIHQEISPALQGQSVLDQSGIDDCLIQLDGTKNKARLGANALLAVSMAVARAAAKVQKLPLFRYLSTLDPNEAKTPWTLPVPLMNILNGGMHADNGIDFQEFMIVPVGAASFHDALRWGVEVSYALKALLKQKGFQSSVGDEGGFAPALSSNGAAIDMVLQAIEKAGFKAGSEIGLALDLASNGFYHEGKYYLKKEQKVLTSKQFVDYLSDWVKQYPLLSIEDGMSEEDYIGWKLLTERLGDRVQLVGDDLFVTDSVLLKDGITRGFANAVLIKLNQIGTLTETIGTLALGKRAGYATVVSHRSGETEDPFIADFAVGLSAGQIKTGGLCRSERMAKYNQLLRIEMELGTEASYAGKQYQTGVLGLGTSMVPPQVQEQEKV